MRDPKDLIIRAQTYLQWKQRNLRLADQAEWDILAEAYNVLEKCLKLVEEK